MTNLTRETERLLQLSFLPGVGAAALRKFVQRAQTAGPQSLWDDEVAVPPKSTNRRGKQNREGWREVVHRCGRDGIDIISVLDGDYPVALRYIDDFPAILYVKGNRQALRDLGCAVVGTREASQLGVSWARQI